MNVVSLLIELVAYVTSVVLPAFYGLLLFSDTPDDLPSETIGLKRLKLEYKILNDSVRQRENSLLSSGSIFVAASLILLGQAALVTTNIDLGVAALVFGSWFIYSIWLFAYQLTTVKLTSVTFGRLRWLEHRLGFEAHRMLIHYRIPIRKWLWFDGLCALLIMGNPLLGLP